MLAVIFLLFAHKKLPKTLSLILFCDMIEHSRGLDSRFCLWFSSIIRCVWAWLICGSPFFLPQIGIGLQKASAIMKMWRRTLDIQYIHWFLWIMKDCSAAASETISVEKGSKCFKRVWGRCLHVSWDMSCKACSLGGISRAASHFSSPLTYTLQMSLAHVPGSHETHTESLTPDSDMAHMWLLLAFEKWTT